MGFSLRLSVSAVDKRACWSDSRGWLVRNGEKYVIWYFPTSPSVLHNEMLFSRCTLARLRINRSLSRPVVKIDSVFLESGRRWSYPVYISTLMQREQIKLYVAGSRDRAQLIGPIISLPGDGAPEGYHYQLYKPVYSDRRHPDRPLLGKFDGVYKGFLFLRTISNFGLCLIFPGEGF